MRALHVAPPPPQYSPSAPLQSRCSATLLGHRGTLLSDLCGFYLIQQNIICKMKQHMVIREVLAFRKRGESLASVHFFTAD